MNAEEVTKVLAADQDLAIAILFGSVSRNQQKPSSDLDVAVAGKGSLNAEKKAQLIETLAQLSGRPVDVVDLQGAPEPIYSAILRTGTLLFCRDYQLYAELIKRMWFNQADFVPLRSRILAERRKAWIDN